MSRMVRVYAGPQVYAAQYVQRSLPCMDAKPPATLDPLATLRSDGGDHQCDLLLTGTVFQDIIFTGLPHAPEPGTEVWSEGMGSCPGGVANQAIAAARLGLRTNLAATFGGRRLR